MGRKGDGISGALLMKLRGWVVKRTLYKATKSEHEGLVLLTSEGEFKLRRQGGNPFRGRDPAEGTIHHVRVEIPEVRLRTDILGDISSWKEGIGYTLFWTSKTEHGIRRTIS
jgi:hypothetical protein